MHTVKRVSVLQTNKTTFLKGVGTKGADLNYFGNGVCETEGKRTVHKHCTLVGNCFPRENGFTILKQLYMYTGTEQLSKWMADVGVRFFTFGMRGYR